jgi:hypothetical protein
MTSLDGKALAKVPVREILAEITPERIEDVSANWLD